jgi:hypothetical protein
MTNKATAPANTNAGEASPERWDQPGFAAAEKFAAGNISRLRGGQERAYGLQAAVEIESLQAAVEIEIAPGAARARDSE